MVTENDHDHRPDRPSPTRPNFIYNKSGIPLSNESWLKMWKFYQKDYEQLKSEIEYKVRSEKPNPRPLPSIPEFNPKIRHAPTIDDVKNFLIRVTKYFKELQYNHTGWY